jgi:hypothetical protein
LFSFSLRNKPAHHIGSSSTIEPLVHAELSMVKTLPNQKEFWVTILSPLSRNHAVETADERSQRRKAATKGIQPRMDTDSGRTEKMELEHKGNVRQRENPRKNEQTSGDCHRGTSMAEGQPWSPRNLKIPLLIINDLRILRFMGAMREKSRGILSWGRGPGRGGRFSDCLICK